jgi:hypothetical protein
MPLASLIKLLGTRRRELELNNNEKIIVNNYKRPMLNFQSRLKKKNGKFRRGGLLTSIVKFEISPVEAMPTSSLSILP